MLLQPEKAPARWRGGRRLQREQGAAASGRLGGLMRRLKKALGTGDRTEQHKPRSAPIRGGSAASNQMWLRSATTTKYARRIAVLTQPRTRAVRTPMT